jgi:ceramide glucosyltransferase
MDPAIRAAAFLAAVAISLHVISSLIAVARCARRTRARPAREGARPVTIVRPVCGLDNHEEETLRSTFALDYPCYEIVFCVANGRDPVIPLVKRLMAEHPHISARLLVGEDRINDNPKLNNAAKGWNAAAHDWIAITDSNVLLPTDFIDRLFARWRDGIGLVCAPPIGARPQGFWGEVECGFLNTYQARWQYAADAFGLGFAQGKVLFWHRPDLEAAGGIRALGAEPAEDAAATKIVRAAGLKVTLVNGPFQQPLGERRLADVWRRQVRWARLRRMTFPLYFAPEILTSSLVPIVLAAYAGLADGMSAAGVAALGAGIAFAWYGAEAVLARAAGWQLDFASPLAWMTRDLMLPVLWVQAWTGSGFTWRGTEMDFAEGREGAA